MSLGRTNTDVDVWIFPKLATPVTPETQTGGIEFATDYISFETIYISSGINSIYFGITCISANPTHLRFDGTRRHRVLLKEGRRTVCPC